MRKLSSCPFNSIDIDFIIPGVSRMWMHWPSIDQIYLAVKAYRIILSYANVLHSSFLDRVMLYIMTMKPNKWKSNLSSLISTKCWFIGQPDRNRIYYTNLQTEKSKFSNYVTKPFICIRYISEITYLDTKFSIRNKSISTRTISNHRPSYLCRVGTRYFKTLISIAHHFGLNNTIFGKDLDPDPCCDWQQMNIPRSFLYNGHDLPVSCIHFLKHVLFKEQGKECKIFS